MHFNSAQSRSAWTEQVSLSRRSLQVHFCFYTSATQYERPKRSRQLLPSSYLHHHRFAERESFACSATAVSCASVPPSHYAFNRICRRMNCCEMPWVSMENAPGPMWLSWSLAGAARAAVTGVCVPQQHTPTIAGTSTHSTPPDTEQQHWRSSTGGSGSSVDCQHCACLEGGTQCCLSAQPAC